MASYGTTPRDAAVAQAERERLQEDLRLLYVALTRPRYACWVGVACVSVGNARQSSLHKSAFGYLLSGGAPIEPSALMPALLQLRGGEEAIAVDTLPESPAPLVLRPSESEAETTRPARDYASRPGERWWIASYSALRYAEDEDTGEAPAAPETPAQDVLAEAGAEQPVPAASAEGRGIHAFPRGAVAGTFLHDLLEWAAEEGFAEVAAHPQALAELIQRRVQRHGWQAHAAMLAEWLPALLRTPLPLEDGRAVALAELRDPSRYRAEMEFWFAVNRVDTRALDRLVTTHTLGGRPRLPLLADRLNGMLKGFIDLLFEHDGRYYVADYKSNWLGPDTSAYTAEAVRDSVLRERYDLQYALYTLALHRQLRARLPDYDYERHVGGVLYLYLRGIDGSGHGVHYERLPRALVEAMDRLFDRGALAEGAADAA
jgi:exodeoxyribonuclease V beta subunit